MSVFKNKSSAVCPFCPQANWFLKILQGKKVVRVVLHCPLYCFIVYSGEFLQEFCWCLSFTFLTDIRTKKSTVDLHFVEKLSEKTTKQLTIYMPIVCCMNNLMKDHKAKMCVSALHVSPQRGKFSLCRKPLVQLSVSPPATVTDDWGPDAQPDLNNLWI